MSAPRHAVLEIYDDIGPYWMGMIDARLVTAKLSNLGDLDEIEVRINSRGGDAFEGFAIHNILKQHPANVVMRVMGVAASSAATVLCAGDTVIVPKNAMVMIHNPATFVTGGEKVLTAALAKLAAITKSAVETYVTRSGLPESQIVKMMDEETWMTGEEALAKGFADTLGPELDVPSVAMQADLSLTLPAYFSKPPEQFSRLVAMTASTPKESTMTTPTAPTIPATPAPAASAQPPTAPVAPPAATLAVSEPPTKSAAELVHEAIAQERTRVASITALCTQAGKPELAQKHIDDGTAVMVVQTSLFALLCAERPPVGTGNSTMSAATGDEKYKQEYALQRDVYLQAGVSEEQYIKTRRIDDAGGEVRLS